MKTIKISDEMYNELVQIVNIAVNNSVDWVKCCERNAELKRCISDAKNDLTKAKKLLNKLCEGEK